MTAPRGSLRIPGGSLISPDGLRMGRKRGLTPDDVVAAGAELADARGLDGVTLAAVAQRLRVRSPSLYAHIGGLEDLHRRLSLMGAQALREAFLEAARGREGEEALRALFHAYRSFARLHPGLYAATQRGVAAEYDEELTDALQSVLDPVLRALTEEGVPEEALIHVTRGVRSALHGFVTLELEGGFGLPDSVEESFRRLVDLLLSGVKGATAQGSLTSPTDP